MNGTERLSGRGRGAPFGNPVAKKELRYISNINFKIIWVHNNYVCVCKLFSVHIVKWLYLIKQCVISVHVLRELLLSLSNCYFPGKNEMEIFKLSDMIVYFKFFKAAIESSCIPNASTISSRGPASRTISGSGQWPVNFIKSCGCRGKYYAKEGIIDG